MPSSRYLAEMKMSNEERMAELLAHKKKLKYKVDKSALIDLTPASLIFQNYSCGGKNVGSFIVRNMSKKSLLVIKIIYEVTPLFRVHPGINLIKLAPGMNTTFTVSFHPPCYKDYFHLITFDTGDSQYRIPIVGLGPRPLVNFPDEFHLPPIPVKQEITANICVRNVGAIAAKFNLKIQKPFSVSPQDATLNAGENAVFAIKLKTNINGRSSEKLFVTFDSGEKIFVNVIACCKTVETVKIVPPVIHMKDAFTDGLSSATVSLVNNSPHRLDFSWMRCESGEKDYPQVYESFEKFREKHYERGDEKAEASDVQIEKQFEEELRLLFEANVPYYHNKNFEISPVCGDIWPNTEREVTITFTSNAFGNFSSVAFCEISGNLQRYPLRMTALCSGPKLRFEVNTKMIELFLGSVYTFSVAVLNEGNNKSGIIYDPQISRFGIDITCEPTSLILNKHSKGELKISLLARLSGPYIETMVFNMLGSSQTIKFTIRGKVISPSMQINPESFSIGEVGIGITETLFLNIKNISQMQVHIYFKVAADGQMGKSLTLQDMMEAAEKPVLSQKPKEFLLEPKSCSLAPEAQIILKIWLTANLCRTHHTHVQIFFENSDSLPLSVPISFTASFPSIVVETSLIKIDKCYLALPYTNTISLKNTSRINGYFYFPNEPSNEQSVISWEAKPNQGLIKPFEIVKIDLIVQTNISGKNSTNVYFQLLGNSSSTLLCKVNVFGTGPEVVMWPKALHWGEVNVLVLAEMKLVLSNTSPIPALIRLRMKKKQSPWNVMGDKLVVPADESLEVVLGLTLKDVGFFSDSLMILVEKSKEKMVAVSATGVGIPLMIEPLMLPFLDLGFQLSFKKLKSPVKLTNFGSKALSFKWTTTYNSKKKKNEPDPFEDFFKILPIEFQLDPDEHITMYIEAFTEKTQLVSEHWFLVSIVGGQLKDLIMEMDIIVNFVKPSLETSKTHMKFQLNQGPYEEQFYLLDHIVIKNTSLASVVLDVSTKNPFQIVVNSKIPQWEDDINSPCAYSNILLDIVGKVSKYRHQIPYSDEIFICDDSSDEDENVNLSDIKVILDRFCETVNIADSHLYQVMSEESVYVNVIFTPTSQKIYESKNYNEKLVIQHVGHPKKQIINLQGEVNYPDVKFLPTEVTMECIPKSMDSILVTINNISPLSMNFRLAWAAFKIDTKSHDSNAALKEYEYLAAESEDEHKAKFVNPEVLSLPSTKPDLFCYKSPAVQLTSSRMQYPVPPPSLVSALSLDSNTCSDFSDSSCLSSLSEYRLSENEVQRRKEIVTATIRSILTYEDPYDLTELYENLPRPPIIDPNRPIHINEVFEILPVFGKLDPYEKLNINVAFVPKVPMSASGTVTCKLLGDVSRTFVISAECSTLDFSVTPYTVEFGQCLFYKIYAETFQIKNTGNIAFEFHTIIPALSSEHSSIMAFKPVVKSINPSTGKLFPGSSMELCVKLLPGMVGAFSEYIQIEISDIDPINVYLEGFGIFPQVYLNLEKLNCQIQPEFVYRALGLLSEKWLICFRKQFRLENAITPKELVEPPACLEVLENEGWDVNFMQMVPYHEDVELAVERFLLYEKLNLLPNSILTHLEGIYAPDYHLNFRSPQQVIDFGTVLVGKYVIESVFITNYSPSDVNLKLVFLKNQPKWLQVTLPECIQPGMTDSLIIEMNPTTEFVKTSYHAITYLFLVQVVYGISIPVVIKAIFSAPWLLTINHPINFNTIICGDFKVCSLPIFNVGYVPCNWSASLNCTIIGGKPALKRICPFRIYKTEGCLKLQENDWIRLLFRPSVEGSYEAELVFRVEMNPAPFSVYLFGECLTPLFEVIGNNAQFQPTIPFSEKQSRLFGVYNPNKFPVRVQFSNSKRCFKSNSAEYILDSEKDSRKVKIDSSFSKIDPILWKDCENFQVKEEINYTVKKIFIICFSAPYTRNFQFIKDLGRYLNISITNIDALIKTYIAYSDSQLAVNCRQGISMAFQNAMAMQPVTETTLDTDVETECMDEYDLLEFKIKMLNAMYTSPIVSKKKAKAPPSAKQGQAEPDASSASNIDYSGPNVIPEGIALECLRSAVEQASDGLILESLESKFFFSPNASLLSILAALPGTEFINLIIFHNTISQYTEEKAADECFRELQNATMTKEENQQMITTFNDYVKDLTEILSTSDFWHCTQKRLILPVSQVRTKSHTTKSSGKKRLSQASQISSEEATENNLDLGLYTWIIQGLPDHYLHTCMQSLYAIKNQPIPKANLKLLELPLVYSRYLPCWNEDMNFCPDDPPFTIACEDLYSVKACLQCNKYRAIPTEKSDPVVVQGFLLHCTCVCGSKKNSLQELSLQRSKSYHWEFETNFVPSMMLEPSHIMRFKILFSPEFPGVATKKFKLSVAGYSKINHKLLAQGVCDIQRINTDPRQIFSKVLIKSKHSKQCAYLNSIDKFDFGLILLTPKETEISKANDKFKITNVSRLPMEVSFSFLEAGKCFSVFPDHLTIEASKTKSISVTAFPNAPDIFENTLLCIVEDNPEIVQIKLVCRGIQPAFHIQESALDFDKMPLYRVSHLKLTLVNECLLPLRWKVQNLQEFSDFLCIELSEDVLAEMSLNQVQISCIAQSTVLIKNQILNIGIYDQTGKVGPLLTFSLPVSYETYNVVIQCFFEPPSETHVNYGEVLVKTSLKRVINIANAGPNLLLFRIIRNPQKKKDLEQLMEKIEVTPLSGVLKPMDKPLTLTLTCIPVVETRARQAPLFTCQLLDSDGQRLIATIPIQVSVIVHFNKFTVYPERVIDFGYVCVNEERSKELLFSNIGQYSFHFTMDFQPINNSTPEDSTFVLSSNEGQLGSHDQVCIMVTCKPTVLGPHSKEILIKVPNTPPKLEDFRVSLKVHGVLPDLDWNEDGIFKDCLIAKTYDDYIPIKEMKQHCLYVKDDACLYFNRTCVGSVNRIRIYLKNPTTILCCVNLCIKEEVSSEFSGCFDILQNICVIDPGKKKHVDIKFTPKYRQFYNAVLECSVNMPDNKDAKKYVFGLFGEGMVPKIRFIQPLVMDQKCNVLFKLPPTFVNDCCYSEIKFQNTSDLTCDIQIQIVQNDNETEENFNIISIPNEDIVKKWTPDEPFTKECQKSLLPTEMGRIHLKFNPTSVGEYKAEILFDVAKNPFNKYKVRVEALCFFDEITLLGLDIVSLDKFEEKILKKQDSQIRTSFASKSTPKSTDKNRKISALLSNPLDDFKETNIENIQTVYSFDNGYFNVGDKVHRTLVMANHSLLEAFRFVWEKNEFVTVNPSIGHIMPNEKKDLILTFKTNQVLSYWKTPIFCCVSPIIEPSSWTDCPRGWDERHKLTYWHYHCKIQGNLRQTQNVLEPDVKLADFYNSVVILLTGSVVENRSRYCTPRISSDDFK